MHLIIVIPLRSLRTTPTIQRRNKRTNINNHNLSRWTLLLLLRSLTLVPFFVCCYYSSGRKEGRKTGQQQVVNVHFVLLETFGWKKNHNNNQKKKIENDILYFFFWLMRLRFQRNKSCARIVRWNARTGNFFSFDSRWCTWTWSTCLYILLLSIFHISICISYPFL